MKSKGFTFIEMLVVVTIIGVLASIGVANFKVANQKARDGRRQGDLQQIRAALELYRTDVNIYPTTGNLSLLEPDYIGTIPTDPTTGYLYPYTSVAGTTYTLCSALELSTATVTDCGSCGTATCRYKITNPL
ncbi:prepilin-type N-terminal cleavage/methylation domain-containing protein [Patescibacteria group bacterium]|nr:prepilin-type N-terminal cleavage/methylation domain-containing protein [Patescibacteria group bacterium]MBU1499878.1 prepilin-type N-terminal cleavage/methylation domain-containing protein [Patescibacteria group bacterium]